LSFKKMKLLLANNKLHNFHITNPHQMNQSCLCRQRYNLRDKGKKRGKGLLPIFVDFLLFPNEVLLLCIDWNETYIPRNLMCFSIFKRSSINLIKIEITGKCSSKIQLVKNIISRICLKTAMTPFYPEASTSRPRKI